MLPLDHYLYLKFVDNPFIIPIIVLSFLIFCGIKLKKLILKKLFFEEEDEDDEIVEEEFEERLSRWVPEPLVPKSGVKNPVSCPRIVTSKFGKTIVVDNKECINLSTHNYLGFAEDSDCIEKAIETVRKYGVGSCGPRGFFGTVDVHLKLEEVIAQFMKTEEAILYSYGYVTISSAIPAYSKQDDVIFVDEGVNFSIQQGLTASRSKIYFFKHNDMEDLERLLVLYHKNRKINKSKQATFLVVEGLYVNIGDICPLPKLIELKKRFKVRLFIDDTCGFGVLGKTGRGIIEHFNFEVDDVDMISASLEYCLSSYGGFCTGTQFVIDHQRLSGLGYCFSASLPPLQAAYAIEAIHKMQNHPEKLEDLKEKCIAFHKLILAHSNLIQVDGVDFSPIKHIRYADSLINSNVKDQTELLEKVVKLAYDSGYALTIARYLKEWEYKPPRPSIRLIISTTLNHDEIAEIVRMLVRCFRKALTR